MGRILIIGLSTRRSRELIAVGGAALAIILAAVGCGGSGVRKHEHTARFPPDLQALVAKMRALHVTSERFVRSMSTTIDASKGAEHFDQTMIGEVGLSPDRGETFHPGPVPIPLEAVTLGRAYSYSSALAGCDGGRPWVLRQLRHEGVLDIGGKESVKPSRPERRAQAALPFQALPGERTRGGTGPFGGLIDLLETTTGPVQSVGAATVDGERTTEFSARVDPAALLAGVTEADLPALRPPNEDLLILQQRLHTLPTQLHLYLSNSGLPVRITTSALFGGNYLTAEQVDLISVNGRVSVAAPPARRVIGARQAAEYDGLTLFAHTKPCPALTHGRRAPIGG